MLFYLILYCFLLIITCFFEKTKFVFVFVILLYTVIIGFRGSLVGADTISYIQMYNSIGQLGYSGYPEPIYGFLCEFFYLSGFSFNEFQLILSLLTLFLGGYTIYKYSPNPIFSLYCLFAMYFICYAMNINRQVEAGFLLLFAYNFYFKKKYIQFVAIVLIAMGFHFASVLILLVLLLHKLPINSFFVFFGLLISFCIGLIFNNNMILSYTGPYSGYLQEGVSLGFRNSERLIYAILLTIYWMIGFLFIWKTIKGRLKDSIFMKQYFFTVILNNLMMRLELGIRIVLLFSILQIIFYSLYIDSSCFSKPVAKLFIVCYLTIFFITFLSIGSAGVVPYLMY